MPAYFSVEFQYTKKDIGKIGKIYNALIDCGLKFKSGYYESENDSWEDIIAWNQGKFADDFELGYEEHHSHDYKQMLFDFYDFSEVRLFILNVHGATEISFHLIIPEADLLEDTHLCDIMSKTDKMKWIEQLAIDMWRQGGICSIQVGWEGSECGITMEEMINGIKPIAEPFAIVPSALYRAEWGLEKREIEGDGIFIYNKEHWYYLSV